ncbi:hypothetical protein ACHWQZ_G013709 [Mnemiopsis leidyi]
MSRELKEVKFKLETTPGPAHSTPISEKKRRAGVDYQTPPSKGRKKDFVPDDTGDDGGYTESSFRHALQTDDNSTQLASPQDMFSEKKRRAGVDYQTPPSKGRKKDFVPDDTGDDGGYTESSFRHALQTDDNSTQLASPQDMFSEKKRRAGVDYQTPPSKGRKKDFVPDDTGDDGGYTESSFRHALQTDDNSTQLASPQDMFRFLLRLQYKSDTYIPPVRGAKNGLGKV